MSYSNEQIKDLSNNLAQVKMGLDNLFIRVVRIGYEFNPEATEQIHQGIGRRLKIINRCIENIFSIFPIDRKDKLSGDELDDLHINLHSFVINLYGLFENLAWAFSLVHKLELKKFDIGLYKDALQARFSIEFKQYLNSPKTLAWFKEYLIQYRDALAHRIPLYVPPFLLNEMEGIRYNELQVKINEFDFVNFDELKKLRDAQNRLGSPCFFFHLSTGGKEKLRPIYLHPQLLCDGMTVIELTHLYLDNLNKV